LDTLLYKEQGTLRVSTLAIDPCPNCITFVQVLTSVDACIAQAT
jgi:hypothetical protein